ncbi:hypothetical protein HU200_066890 [Digitaria exilis]|uniref:Uncharacterized protein n=1 Tax=Digitaria exilis TaxID=1010633 RepID=A0A835DTF6_9POAL|nr:hypothetical protein HU200_066890 [Digitaria exilis]
MSGIGNKHIRIIGRALGPLDLVKFPFHVQRASGSRAKRHAAARCPRGSVTRRRLDPDRFFSEECREDVAWHLSASATSRRPRVNMIVSFTSSSGCAELPSRVSVRTRSTLVLLHLRRAPGGRGVPAKLPVCVAQQYALNHLVLFMVLFVSLVDF